MRVAACNKCGKEKPHYAKGFCEKCYQGERRVRRDNLEAHPREMGFVFDAKSDKWLYEALAEMAEEDCRTVVQEIRWILKEYVKDHKRYLEREAHNGRP